MGALVLGFIIYECNTEYFRDLYAENVLEARRHRVPCEKWPTKDEAKRLTERHADVVTRIEAVNPGHIQFRLRSRHTGGCRGRADIHIYFASVSNRDEIIAIIGDEKYFFGVPYDMANW